MMQIFVRSEELFVLDVDPTDTILDVKNRFQRKLPSGFSLPLSEQRLLFGGRSLADDSTLSDCNVHPASILDFVLRIRGGLTVFRDPVSKCEMISDAFPSVICKDPDGNDIIGLRSFQSRKMTAGGEEINTGGGGAFGGAGEDEVVDDTIATVDAIEYTFRLQPLEMSMKELQNYLQVYIHSIRLRWRAEGRPKEEIQGKLMGQANAVVTFLLTKIKECEVFINAEFNQEGSICLREWTEAGNVYYYLMSGLEGGRDKCAF